MANISKSEAAKLHRKMRTLTDREHDILEDSFYKVESMLHVLRENYGCTGRQEFDHIANLVQMADEKLQRMAPILFK